MNKIFKKVLVTGGSGCIGIPLLHELRKQNIHVVLFDLNEQINRVRNYLPKDIDLFSGSILDTAALRDAMNDCDGVIHLAAHLGVYRTENNKLRCLEINIDGTKKVLNACAQSKSVKKIIFASSSEVYGEPQTNPISESHPTQGKTVYGVSKLAGEELVKAYCEEFSEMSYTILRFFNTYGPFQVNQFVITKFINSILNGKPPKIFGDGSQLRSYNFSSDSAIGIVNSLLSTNTNNVVMNIGNSNEPITLIDLAKLIMELTGNDDLKLDVKNSFKSTDREKEREIFYRYCSTDLAKSLINYSPKTNLRDGIKKIIETNFFSDSWATSEKSYSLSLDD